jgi:hypothetical protein
VGFLGNKSAGRYEYFIIRGIIAKNVGREKRIFLVATREGINRIRGNNYLFFVYAGKGIDKLVVNFLVLDGNFISPPV